jgi:hypothetical protein
VAARVQRGSMQSSGGESADEIVYLPEGKL